VPVGPGWGSRGAAVVYAGVNPDNLPAVAAAGVKMVGVASAIDDLVYGAMARAVGAYLRRDG